METFVNRVSFSFPGETFFSDHAEPEISEKKADSAKYWMRMAQKKSEVTFFKKIIYIYI